MNVTKWLRWRKCSGIWVQHRTWFFGILSLKKKWLHEKQFTVLHFWSVCINFFPHLWIKKSECRVQSKRSHIYIVFDPFVHPLNLNKHFNMSWWIWFLPCDGVRGWGWGASPVLLLPRLFIMGLVATCMHSDGIRVFYPMNKIYLFNKPCGWSNRFHCPVTYITWTCKTLLVKFPTKGVIWLKTPWDKLMPPLNGFGGVTSWVFSLGPVQQGCSLVRVQFTLVGLDWNRQLLKGTLRQVLSLEWFFPLPYSSFWFFSQGSADWRSYTRKSGKLPSTGWALLIQFGISPIVPRVRRSYPVSLYIHTYTRTHFVSYNLKLCPFVLIYFYC